MLKDPVLPEVEGLTYVKSDQVNGLRVWIRSERSCSTSPLR